MKNMMIWVTFFLSLGSLSFAGNGITFNIQGGTLTQQYKSSLSRPAFLILSKVQDGVNLTISTSDSFELKAGDQIVAQLKKKLRNAKGRMFSRSPGVILITTGMRHAPTAQDLDNLLKEVVTVIKPVATELRLLSIQSVKMN